MMRAFAAIAALLISAVLPPTRPPASPAVARRPVVLLVHGRGQVGDSASLLRVATRALQEGAEAVSGSPLLQDGDVRLVWYADVLAGGSPVSPACPALKPKPKAREGASATEIGALDMFSLVAGVFLEFAGDSLEDTPMASVRALIGDVRFLTNPGARCVAEERIGNAIAAAAREGRPVILVGHSLGGLMAWGHLQDRARTGQGLPAIARFVTLGSPVGSPEVRHFVFGSQSALQLPAGVGSWVNVVDADDPFSAPLLPGMEADTTTTLATVPGLRDGMRDAMTESRRADAHELRGYLRDPAATHAILDAWCSALHDDRNSAPACATLALTSPMVVGK
jgi:pimeloyl-ACP methyl ester carboxylesterase